MRQFTSATVISDLHLDDATPARTDMLATFLAESVTEATFVLGDLFNYWLGDDLETATSRRVATLFATQSRRQRVCIMRGNRDFLLGHDYLRRCGAQLLPDPTPVCVAGRHILLMHGDSLCTLDAAYWRFRHSRSAFRQALRGKTAEARRTLVAQMRTRSRQHQRDVPSEILDVAPAAVRRHMRAWHVSHLIHGHTHKPEIRRHSTGRRYVLSDWQATGFHYITLDGAGVHLRQYRA